MVSNLRSLDALIEPLIWGVILMMKIVMDVLELERMVRVRGQNPNGLVHAISRHWTNSYMLPTEPLDGYAPVTNISNYILDEFFNLEIYNGLGICDMLPNDDTSLKIRINNGYLTILIGEDTDVDRFRGLLHAT